MIGDVSGIESNVAEKPYLNRGLLTVTVGILTIDGKAAPSMTYISFDDDAPHPPVSTIVTHFVFQILYFVFCDLYLMSYNLYFVFHRICLLC